jgi:hypothetical protein
MKYNFLQARTLSPSFWDKPDWRTMIHFC